MVDFQEGTPGGVVENKRSDEEEREGFWEEIREEVSKPFLMDKAQALAWSESINERIVNFEQGDGKVAWGIEYTIPLSLEGAEREFRRILKKLDNKDLFSKNEIDELVENNKGKRFYQGTDDIKLPENVSKIRVLDLHPQEGMRRDLKSIRLAGYKGRLKEFFPGAGSGRRLSKEYGNSVIDRVMLNLYQETRSNIVRTKVLNELFDNVFSGDEESKRLFEKVLDDTGGNELLFIHAHGGGDDVVGEQTTAVVGEYADKRQVEGNRVDLSQVIERYDEPDRLAAILICSCYSGSKKPPVKSVPVFRLKGVAAGGRDDLVAVAAMRSNETLVSMPKEGQDD